MGQALFTPTQLPDLIDYFDFCFVTFSACPILFCPILFCLSDPFRPILFVREAQELARALHGQNAVYPDRLEIWAEQPDFKVSPDGAMVVLGYDPGSRKLTKKQQVARGGCNIGIEDLAVAHAAYFIATGFDMFDGYVVRARRGKLEFSGNGLIDTSDESDFDSEHDDTFGACKHVFACQAFNPQNQDT